jgi:protein-S-isoprenylcysteine O-methyltransferase Ste14
MVMYGHQCCSSCQPSYLGLELILLACALQARTWACFAVALVPSTLALLYRIHVEETALRLAF